MLSISLESTLPQAQEDRDPAKIIHQQQTETESQPHAEGNGSTAPETTQEQPAAAHQSDYRDYQPPKRSFWDTMCCRIK